MLLSALFVYFRDIQPIWEVITQVLFYASPVIIPIETVQAEASSPSARPHVHAQPAGGQSCSSSATRSSTTRRPARRRCWADGWRCWCRSRSRWRVRARVRRLQPDRAVRGREPLSASRQCRPRGLVAIILERHAAGDVVDPHQVGAPAERPWPRARTSARTAARAAAAARLASGVAEEPVVARLDQPGQEPGPDRLPPVLRAPSRRARSPRTAPPPSVCTPTGSCSVLIVSLTTSSLPPGLSTRKRLLERPAQAVGVVVVQDLAAEHVVEAARRDRHVVHRAEHPLEVRGAVLDEVVRGVQPLQLGGGDVQRDHAEAAHREVVRRPARVRPDVQRATARAGSRSCSSSWLHRRACTYQ